jgi:CRP-like cAMP-binding protein
MVMGAGALGRTYRDGEVIVRQGDRGDCMYVIQEGRAEILVERDGKEVRLRVAGKGEIIGDMSVFESKVRSATVKALGEVQMLTLDRKNFLRRAQEDPSVVFRLLEMMSRRVRELSDEVARLKG